MSVLANRIYYINSEERNTGSSSNFSFNLDVPDGASFDSVCVLSMTIPKSYYLIRDGYNTFKLTNGTGEYVISITPGNYNVINFVTTVLPLLNAHGTFTMVFNSITGKYTFTGDCTLEFYSPLARQFGFDETSVNTFIGQFSSANVVDFSSTSTLFLHSDMVDDTTSILQEVYADNTVAYSNIVYNCKFPGMYSKKLGKPGSTVFNFSLTDEHQHEVFLNGHDICITILMYKKENLTRLFRQIFTPGGKM